MKKVLMLIALVAFLGSTVSAGIASVTDTNLDNIVVVDKDKDKDKDKKKKSETTEKCCSSKKTNCNSHKEVSKECAPKSDCKTAKKSCCSHKKKE